MGEKEDYGASGGTYETVGVLEANEKETEVQDGNAIV